MKNKFFLFLISFLFLFSCKENECVIPSESEINTSFYPMTVGSYWIYHWYEVDTFGNEELLSWIDTARIIKDTLIDGIVFKKKENMNRTNSPGKFYEYLRVSNGNLLNENGDILFSSNNFIDTLNQIISAGAFEINYKMAIPDESIFTPLGAFDCLNFRGKVIPFIATDWTSRFLNNYYSKGVGKVMSSTFFFSSPNNLERRLVEYHIE